MSENYGDRAWSICSMAKPTGLSWPLHGVRLAPGYPVIEAEVRYACRFEFAVHATDFIGRRSRLSFLNTDATINALPRVLEIMAEEHKWDDAHVEKEFKRAMDYLLSMGIKECVLPCLFSQSFSLADSYHLRSRSKAQTQLKDIPRTQVTISPVRKPEPEEAALYSRALFTLPEIEALKKRFTRLDFVRCRFLAHHS